MSVADEIKRIAKEKGALSGDLQDQIKFYNEMVRQGIAKKEEYNIPLVDTVGVRCVNSNMPYFD